MDWAVRGNIVFIINSMIGGGAERVMARLLSHSGQYGGGREVHLVLLDEEPVAYTVPDDVQVHHLDTGGTLVGGFFKLFKLLRQLRPEICFSFLSRSNFLNVLTGNLLRNRIIISERVHTTAHHGNSLTGKVSKLLTWLLYRHAHRLIVQSGGVRDDLRDHYGVPAKKIIIIANPVDAAAVIENASKKADHDYGSPLIVGMGRLVPNKNFALLIEAFAAAKIPGNLLIMGEGPLHDELKALAREKGVAERVFLPGFSANPFPYIKSADCYVLPSNGEGFPNGLIEAMAIGVPVISTNCESGPSEILDDVEKLEISAVHWAKYGVLVPPNDVDAMTGALKAILDEKTHKKQAKLSKDGAARYDLQSALARYWEIVLVDSSD